MYSLSEQLLEQYTFTVAEIQKGRGAYICLTDEGKKIMKEYDASSVRAEALYQILEQVRAQGIQADQIIKTKEDTVLAKDADETTYYVREFIEGRECDTKSREDILSAVHTLAQFHLASGSCTAEIPEGMRISADALLAEYEKHNRELRKVRNYIRSKKSKNEFELIFYRNYASFLEKAEQVTEKLKEQLAQTPDEVVSKMEGICHGDFNQHNVLFYKNEVWLTNFESAVYDVYMRDLANFLRKIMEKHNWSVGLAVDMIGVYEKVRPISPIEMEQLYIRVCYPEKFWKIANHYYNSNKSWVSGRNIEKLNKVITQEHNREHFLRILFNFLTE